MKKMPTLFERIYEGHKIVDCRPVVHEGCEWVLAGEGIATQKLDGTCCMVQDGKLYARYDCKAGRIPPEGAIPCQPEPDPVTGHWPFWVSTDDKPEYKHHRTAFARQFPLEDGTYELCGPHFQRNPEHYEVDTLVRHGSIILDDVPRTFEGIKEYCLTHDIEGIVFHRGDGEMCKIKGSDFGRKRP